MPVSTGRFPRSERLLDSRDFRRVSRTGLRGASRCFVVLVTPRAELGSGGLVSPPVAPSRLGITASRKVGGAVVRNYLKRSIREWFRRERSRFETAVDVVVIARRQAAQLRASEVSQLLTKLMPKPVGGAS